MVEESLEVIDGHYQTALPWRDENLKLPSSIGMAERVLQSLRKRLSNDTELHELYTKAVEGYLNDGHAELAPAGSIPGRTWYLPHHSVTNPNKPGKVRVVFDCQARAGGVSLNDNLLQGLTLATILWGSFCASDRNP